MQISSPTRAVSDAAADAYRAVRANTLSLVEGLSDADCTAQSMEDASPSKWHLAHTTWFWETFLLLPHADGYQVFDDAFGYLFNSYYDAVGARHARPKRGLLTRPTLARVLEYRSHVDAHMERFLGDRPDALADLVSLGLAHEQQHQELLLTDVLHLFAQHPFSPAYRSPQPLEVASRFETGLAFASFEGGLVEIGHEGEGFAFDCEGPRHKVYVEPFRLACRAVTNREWADFIEDGGYDSVSLWLSDGWAARQREGWNAPLYWRRRDDEWWSMTLRGLQPVDPDAPVCHVGFYEADAFATWAGKRLPTETELEIAAKGAAIEGNFAGSGRLRPAPQPPGDKGGVAGLYGDVWEWTSSAFSPYPGFKIAEGAVGEYNGKFMSGQYVLRGGSCATPDGHMRPTYRNFFHPDKRWQFSGLRLAEDG